MHTPYALLRFVGKAVLSALGVGLVGDLLIDVLPDVARMDRPGCVAICPRPSPRCNN
ncbi:MAG TPA: hypothetical protein VFA26_02385 [Gemmataceae bacterium]|nr:hypothetical protein [Gemmataceae bacterium]